MKIKAIKKIENNSTYCLVVDDFHNFVIPLNNGHGIVSSQCWAGAQAFSSFDSYLSPFIRKEKNEYIDDYCNIKNIKRENLSEADNTYIYNKLFAYVKQCMQTFFWGINTPSRWSAQPPFSNVTLDLTVPNDIKDTYPKIGGKVQSYTYGDLAEEMKIFALAFFEVFKKGDSIGNIFQYPILTLNCTKAFFEEIDVDVAEQVWKLTAESGVPYFSNYVNSDMDQSEIRSMCVDGNDLIDVELNEDVVEIEGRFYTMKDALANSLL